MEKTDFLGVPLKTSFTPEFVMLKLLDKIGLTVSEAVELRKENKLPDYISKSWDYYDEFNRQRFGENT